MVVRRVTFSGPFCILLAFILLIFPIRWILSFFVAAFIHELGHYLIIKLVCRKKSQIQFYTWGAKMPLPEMSHGCEALCAISGPILGLSLLLLARWFPRVAICAAMQSVYNLLPIYPLDGGRALQSVLIMILPPPQAAQIYQIIACLCKIIIMLLALYGTFILKLGIFPIILASLLLIRGK